MKSLNKTAFWMFLTFFALLETCYARTETSKAETHTYKLFSSQSRGLAEPIRYMLNYMGLQFDDVIVTDWTPFKTGISQPSPILEIDGQNMYQLVPLTRFLGRQAKLAGETDFEALQIDMAVNSIVELLRLLPRNTDVDKNEIWAKLQQIDTRVNLNQGFLVNGKLSWADIFFIANSDYINFMLGKNNIFEEHTNLAGLRDKVLSQPGISTWLETRPHNI